MFRGWNRGCIRLSGVYRRCVGWSDTGRKQNRSRWRKSIRFTSPFYRRGILSAALRRFAFSCGECCLPAFRRSTAAQSYIGNGPRTPISLRFSDTLQHTCAYAHVYARAQHETVWIRVDDGNARESSIGAHRAKCSHFAKASCGFSDITSHATRRLLVSVCCCGSKGGKTYSIAEG